LYAHLEDLARELNKRGSYLIVKAGVQEDIIMETLKTHDCDALFYNRSYGPSREIRDKTIYEYCQKEYIAVHAYHDYLLVAPSAVPARKVYTPFYKKRLPIVEEVAHIAHYFPYAIPQAFQEKRRKVQRENNKEWFEAWKEGKTGYPLVDA